MADAQRSWSRYRCLYSRRTSVGCDNRSPSCLGQKKARRNRLLMPLQNTWRAPLRVPAAVRLPFLPPLPWRSAGVGAALGKWARGAEEAINEGAESSCASWQGRSRTWMRLCPSGDSKDGLFFFISGDVPWGKKRPQEFCSQRPRRPLSPPFAR